MVGGLDTFKNHFADYRDCYVLIGGSACDVYFTEQELPFRATHDLDMILCVEALTPAFFAHFWDFVSEGGYVSRQKSDGKRQFYRFTHPVRPDFPAMLELFARKADFLPASIDAHLTPIPAGGEASSLSAILLDQDCYDFVMANRREIDGVVILNPIALIVLKAIAWLDLTVRKESDDERIDSRDIRKHKNDIIRLMMTIDVIDYNLPQPIKVKMREFMARYMKMDVDLHSLGISTTFDDIKTRLVTCFGLEDVQ